MRYLPIIALFFTYPALFGQSLVGYWQNWGGNDYVALEQTDPRYNVINLAFAVPAAGTDYDMTFQPCCGETTASFKNKIDLLQSYGVKVNLSIGGGGTPIILNNNTERDVFISSMNALIDAYGVDGIDIDLENASLTVSSTSSISNPTDVGVVNMIYAINQIKNHFLSTYGKKMFLGFAPETAYVQGGQSVWGGEWGAYLPLLHAFRNDLDLLYVQLYNSGSMYGINGGIYNPGTADFIISQTEAVIHGFNVQTQGFFQGFPAAKIAVGLPACYTAAVNGNGFTPVATVKSAIDYLRGTGPKPGSYTRLYGPYSDLGGMMTWSINWDASLYCNPTTYEYAANYAQIFQTNSCAQPELGGPYSTCSISFPYTLNSNTSPETNTTYTWLNLTTGQVLVSNSTTASTWPVNAQGRYKVIRNKNGCIKTDEVEISGSIPDPALSGATSLCAGSPLTVTTANAGRFPPGTSWQWLRNQQPVSGATASSYSGITTDGVYSLRASLGSCIKTTNHTVSSNLPVAVNDCVGAGESALLSLTNASGANYLWYASPTATTPIATGASFNTPVLSSTTTYYALDPGAAGTTTVGVPVTGNGMSALNNYKSPNELYFNANQPFVLKGLTVYPLIYGYAHPFSFEIRDYNDNLLPNGSQSFTVTHPGPYGSLMGPANLTLSGNGITIPAGTGYKIKITSEVGNDHRSSVNYPVSFDAYLTFTGADAANTFPAFHNWVIETSGCSYRVPVTATVHPSCATPVEVCNGIDDDGDGFIDENGPSVSNVQVTNVACTGSVNSGAINITVTGGPVAYLWSNNKTTEDISGLPAGTYTVTITAGACTSTATAIVNPRLSVTATNTAVSCRGGNNGTATANPVAGTPPYSYNWNNGGTTKTITGLIAGTYKVTVTDANGCTKTASTSVSQPSTSMSVTAALTQVGCYGGNTGAINVTVSGGTAPVSYLWNGGITTEDRSGLTAGTYTVTATGATGCTVTKSNVITQPSAPLLITNIAQQILSNGKYKLTITVSGGTSPYKYKKLTTNTYQTSNIHNNVLPGTYVVEVRDANLCTASVTIVLPATAPQGMDQPGEETASFLQERTVDFSGIASETPQLFPNPAVNQVRVHFPETWDQGLLRCVDINGKLILEQKLITGQKDYFLDLSNWESGVYTVQAVSGQYSAAARLVVTKP